jgi:hypothetical protein
VTALASIAVMEVDPRVEMGAVALALGALADQLEAVTEAGGPSQAVEWAAMVERLRNIDPLIDRSLGAAPDPEFLVARRIEFLMLAEWAATVAGVEAALAAAPDQFSGPAIRRARLAALHERPDIGDVLPGS